MDLVVFFVGLAVALLAIDRLFTWAENRGWMYWRNEKHGSAMGNVMGALDEIYNPGRRHQREYVVWLQDAREDDEEGAPPRFDERPRSPRRPPEPRT